MEEREEEDVRDAEVETMMDERTGAAEEGEKGDGRAKRVKSRNIRAI